MKRFFLGLALCQLACIAYGQKPIVVPQAIIFNKNITAKDTLRVMLNPSNGNDAINLNYFNGHAGTVNSLSDNTANGVTISWANRTTTPTPTVTLGNITPSLVTVNNTALGSSTADGLQLFNTQAATSGAQVQVSPAWHMKGAAWIGGSVSQTIDMYGYLKPVTNASSVAGSYRIDEKINGGNSLNILDLNAAGQLTVSSIASQTIALTGSADASSGTASAFSMVLNTIGATHDNDVLVGMLFNNTFSKGSQILTIKNLTGGLAYTNGFYPGVLLTDNTNPNGRASSAVATADITVSGGAVTSVVINYGGSRYAVNDVMTASSLLIGGTGSGFTFQVASVGPYNNVSSYAFQTLNAPPLFAASTSSYPSYIAPQGVTYTGTQSGAHWNDGTHEYVYMNGAARQLDQQVSAGFTTSGNVSITASGSTPALIITNSTTNQPAVEITHGNFLTDTAANSIFKGYAEFDHSSVVNSYLTWINNNQLHFSNTGTLNTSTDNYGAIGSTADSAKVQISSYKNGISQGSVTFIGNSIKNSLGNRFLTTADLSGGSMAILNANQTFTGANTFASGLNIQSDIVWTNTQHTILRQGTTMATRTLTTPDESGTIVLQPDLNPYATTAAVVDTINNHGVTLGSTISNSGGTIDVNSGYAFNWTARHNFGAGVGTSGNISAAANGNSTVALVTGDNFNVASATYTDNTSAASSTLAFRAANVLHIPTFAATNTGVTNTVAATWLIEGAPLNGTNVANSASYAVYIASGNLFAGGGFATSSGLNGNLTGGAGAGTFSSGFTPIQNWGSSSASYRVVLNGTTASQLPIGDAYVGAVVASAPIKLGSSGNHPGLSNFTVSSLGTVNLTGSTTVTQTYNMYVAPVTATIGSNGNFSAYFAGPTFTTSPIFGSTVSAINATATATAAQLEGGTISSTSAAATTITLPTASAIAAQIGAKQGVSFPFVIDNISGANTVTVATNTGITTDSIQTNGTTLTVASGKRGKFNLYFGSTSTAILSRVE